MGPEDTQQFDTSRTRQFTRVAAVRHTRRVAVLAVGGTLLAAGLVLLVLPGPGIPLVLLGLTVLSWEFPAAKRLIFRIKERFRRLREQATSAHR